MRLLQLAQRVPHNLIRVVCLELLIKQPTQLLDAGAPVAVLPDESGGLIQAVSLVAVLIVNERLIRQLLNDELSMARSWR
jgi:hypothetical protein